MAGPQVPPGFLRLPVGVSRHSALATSLVRQRPVFSTPLIEAEFTKVLELAVFRKHTTQLNRDPSRKYSRKRSVSSWTLGRQRSGRGHSLFHAAQCKDRLKKRWTSFT